MRQRKHGVVRVSDPDAAAKKADRAGLHAGRQLGLSVWCEDEAGPFQAVPHPGPSWRPRGHPATQPHEYIRGGTTDSLTLFHPASRQVRLQPAARGTNAVLHAALTTPWSSGQAEGQITRLKLIKRQMYGRASFDLLRRRVLLAA